MDPDEEIFGGARSKRHTRPPAYLQQYEVQYTRGRPDAERDVPHPWEAPVHRTPPPSFQPYTTPPGGDLVCSDRSQIMSSGYQPSQHAEFHQPSFSSPQVAGFITSTHDSELQHLRHEHAQLMQTHQAFQADLKELREVRAEVRELVQVAQSLRADLSQARGQNLSPAQPPALKLSSPPVRRYESTPLAEDGNFADLPPPPWPEPDVDLRNQVGDLALSDMGVTIYQPVVPETRKYSFVFPATETLPPQPYAPDTCGLPPPPTPKELRELLTSAAMPLPANRTTVPVSPRFSSVPAHSNPTVFAPKAEPGLRSVAPYSGSEYVYRGPSPSIPRFSRPDPGEFARLRIALTNLLPPDGTELFKYQILVDHLKFEEARMIADAYLNSSTPFTDTMAALHDKFGQPHQLALRKIASVLESPDIKRGDISAFQRFALHVQSLVGLLKTLGRDGELELSCGSHVARLLSKLPPEQRAEFRRHMFRQPGTTPNLADFSNWLRYETWCHSYDTEPMFKGSHAKSDSGKRTVTILHGVGESSVETSAPWKGPVHKSNLPKWNVIVLSVIRLSITWASVHPSLSLPPTRSGHGFAVTTVVGAVLGHTMLLIVTLKSPATSAKASISALFMKWMSVHPRRRIQLTWRRAAWWIPPQTGSFWINPLSKGGLCSKWFQWICIMKIEPWTPSLFLTMGRRGPFCSPLQLRPWAFRVSQKTFRCGQWEMISRSFRVALFPFTSLHLVNLRPVIRSIMPSLPIVLTCLANLTL